MNFEENDKINNKINNEINNEINDNEVQSDEEFINIEDLIEEKLKLYQIQLNNEELIIKNIGYGSEAPDLIILENFGLNKNLSMYNCILTENELSSELNTNQNLFYPIIKLVEKKLNNNDDKIKEYVYSIGIKLQNNILFEQKINFFELYFFYKQNNNLLQFKQISKNINSSNIIEIILDNYLSL